MFSVLLFVTGFAKTDIHNCTRTEIQFFGRHESYPVVLSRNTTDRAAYIHIARSILLASCLWPCKSMTVYCGMYGATGVP